jgi:hypothetical protein
MSASKSPKAAKVAKTMNLGDIKDFATTPRAGLPKRVGPPPQQVAQAPRPAPAAPVPQKAPAVPPKKAPVQGQGPIPVGGLKKVNPKR